LSVINRHNSTNIIHIDTKLSLQKRIETGDREYTDLLRSVCCCRVIARYIPAITFPIKFEAAKPITSPDIVLSDAAMTGSWLRYEITTAITIIAPAILMRLLIDLAVCSEYEIDKL
jgi:hypothetical protein